MTDRQGAGRNQAIDVLRQAIEWARDWGALHNVLDQAQNAYERGDIDQAAAEDLAIQAAAMARKISGRSEKAMRCPGPSRQSIPAEELLQPSSEGGSDACSACGSSCWWTDPGGREVCNICHPTPMTGRYTSSGGRRK